MPDLTRMTDDRIAELHGIYSQSLFGDVLPFWIQHAIDHEHGGFITSLDRDGSVIDTDKSVWQQGRFTWLLGELYNQVAPNPLWLDVAKQGAQFIDRHCFDAEDGRMWFHVTREGKPIRKRRYAFSESFASIAYGELAQATGEDAYAEKAAAMFRQFVEHNLEPKNTEPKFTDTRPTMGLGFPMITIVTAQQLRETIALPDADQWIDRSIDSIVKNFVKPDIQCVMETVSPAGEIINHFDGRTLNPGHAIEGAWFIMHEGLHRDDSQLIEMGCNMLDWMWQRGWDQQHGGLMYFVDVYGKPVQEYWHDMKFWWPHNEAVIATLMAYLATGDDKYAQMHAQVHDWSYQHFPDTEHGEWYGYLHRDGTVSSPLKGNHWKGPFHLPRMLLVCLQTLEKIQAKRAG